MNKKFLIPLVLVLLGVLIPVVYAATHGDETPEPPSSASVEPAVEEERAQDEVQENQHQEKEDVDAEDEEKEHQESAETAVSDKESSNTGSQSKQSTKGSQDNKSAETKHPDILLFSVIPFPFFFLTHFPKKYVQGILHGFTTFGRGYKYL
jgi:cytoskeletal protein RodZ